MNIAYWARHPLILLRRVWYFGYERLHPHDPFLAPSAVSFLDHHLPRNGRGLEWGSGRSTRWLARRLERLVSIEYDQGWLQTVKSQLLTDGIANVDLRFVSLDHPLGDPTQPTYAPPPKYVALISEYPDSHFDFIEVDGHYRQACAAAALSKLKPGGLLLIDDTNWIDIREWGVPSSWEIVHQSKKINTTTSIWRKPPEAQRGAA